MTYAFRSDGPEASVFQLLVPAGDAPSTAAAIDMPGQQWQLLHLGAVPSPGEAPEYICVSYPWGSGRTANPFDPDRPMSVRARPSLEAALAATQPRAVWLDAACMPAQDPARTLCLRNTGAIYAAAHAVVAVLSPETSSLLDKVRRGEAIDPEDLDRLEKDEWVRRAWTYQEIANSRMISFVAERSTGAPVEGVMLQNALGGAIERLLKAQQIDAYTFQAKCPYLDAFGTLLEDYMIGGHGQRSAYQIICAMEGRSTEDPAARYYAMIGAITSDPTADPEDVLLSAPEAVMRACEAKGDFSFIYTSDARAPGDVGGWRPKPEQLRPIFGWSSSGARQGGKRRNGTLHLHNMARLEPGPLDCAARAYIEAWLKKTVHGRLPPGLRDAVRETLKRAGFGGCGECLEMRSGLFFPRQRLAEDSTPEAFAATEVVFRFGAPGLLLDPPGRGGARFRDVGVFVGTPPAGRKTIIIA